MRDQVTAYYRTSDRYSSESDKRHEHYNNELRKVHSILLSRVYLETFFEDVKQLYALVKDVWIQYAHEEIKLPLASFVTNAVVERVKKMETDYFAQYHFGRSRGYNSLVSLLLRFENRASCTVLKEELKNCSDNIFELVMGDAWTSLLEYCIMMHSESDYMELPEDASLFLCRLFNLTPYPSINKNQAPALESLSNFIDYASPESYIPFHLVFQWQLWNAIIDITHERPRKARRELRRTISNIQSATYDWVAYIDDAIFPGHEKMREDAWEYVDFLEELEQRSYGNNTFFDHPWACGTSSLKILIATHDLVAPYIPENPHVPIVLKLFKILRGLGRVDSWPLMERLEHICGNEGSVNNGRPCVGSGSVTSKNKNISLPKNKETGRIADTGTIRDPRACIIAVLDQKHDYQLTDGDVDILQDTFQISDLHLNPVFLISALQAQANNDLHETTVADDLVTPQIMAISVLRTFLVSAYKHGILKNGITLSKALQRPALAGRLVDALELCVDYGRQDPNQEFKFSNKSLNKLLNDAAKGMEEGREFVDRASHRYLS